MANELKIKKVSELTDKLKESKAIILAEYRGLTVPEISKLREIIFDNSTFEVTKNTLLQIVAKNNGLSEEFISNLKGPTAVAFIRGDVYSTIKELDKFKKINENLQLKCGIVDGKDVNAEKLAELAKLESKEILFTKIAILLKMSTTNVAAISNVFGTKVARTIKAYEDKLKTTGNLSDNDDNKSDPVIDTNDNSNKSSENIEKTDDAVKKSDENKVVSNENVEAENKTPSNKNVEAENKSVDNKVEEK